MVFFFECCDPRYVVYMGKDKFENESLIQYGHPEDVWFHVDKHSSAHVYLRLPPGSMDLMGVKDKEEGKRMLAQMLDSIPKEVVKDMCQLTKANSIEGCKCSEVDIVYTPFLNLKKEERMDTGQVGFKDEAFRKLVTSVEKDKEVLKRLEKTQQERPVDLAEEKVQRDNEERARRKKFLAEQKKVQKEEDKRHAEEKLLKNYSSLQDLEKQSNTEMSKTGTIEECKQIEEDFM